MATLHQDRENVARNLAVCALRMARHRPISSRYNGYAFQSSSYDDLMGMPFGSLSLSDVFFSSCLAISLPSSSSTLVPRWSMLDSLTGLPPWPCEFDGCSAGPPETEPRGASEVLDVCWERWGMESGLYSLSARQYWRKTFEDCTNDGCSLPSPPTGPRSDLPALDMA